MSEGDPLDLHTAQQDPLGVLGYDDLQVCVRTYEGVRSLRCARDVHSTLAKFPWWVQDTQSDVINAALSRAGVRLPESPDPGNLLCAFTEEEGEVDVSLAAFVRLVVEAKVAVQALRKETPPDTTAADLSEALRLIQSEEDVPAVDLCDISGLSFEETPLSPTPDKSLQLATSRRSFLGQEDEVKEASLCSEPHVSMAEGGWSYIAGTVQRGGIEEQIERNVADEAARSAVKLDQVLEKRRQAEGFLGIVDDARRCHVMGGAEEHKKAVRRSRRHLVSKESPMAAVRTAQHMKTFSTNPCVSGGVHNARGLDIYSILTHMSHIDATATAENSALISKELHSAYVKRVEKPGTTGSLHWPPRSREGPVAKKKPVEMTERMALLCKSRRRAEEIDDGGEKEIAAKKSIKKKKRRSRESAMNKMFSHLGPNRGRPPPPDLCSLDDQMLQWVQGTPSEDWAATYSHRRTKGYLRKQTMAMMNVT